MVNKVPITRLGKFFSQEDFDLDTSVGSEWLYGDLNFTLVLYRIDRMKTKTDNVYGESVSDGIKFLPPVEFKGYVKIVAPENKTYGTSKIEQLEPGNLTVSVYQKQLDELTDMVATAPDDEPQKGGYHIAQLDKIHPRGYGLGIFGDFIKQNGKSAVFYQHGGNALGFGSRWLYQKDRQATAIFAINQQLGDASGRVYSNIWDKEYEKIFNDCSITN